MIIRLRGAHVASVLCAVLAAGAAHAQVPRTLNFQGVLNGSNGLKKADGVYSVTFRIYDTLSGGSPLYLEVDTVSVANGVFSTTLGDPTGFPAALHFDKAYYLSVQIGSDAEADTRLPLRAAPFALALPGLRTEQTTDTPNIVGGYTKNTVDAGARGASIGGGGAPAAAGQPDRPNRVAGSYGVVAGGAGNQAGGVNSGQYAAVAGGAGNMALAPYSMVTGGQGNIAYGQWSFIGGGDFHLAYGIESTVGGGFNNTAAGDASAISGGYGNFATAAMAAIGGGGRTVRTDPSTGNRITDDYGTIAGGGNNRAGNENPDASDADFAAVGGGLNNTASAPYATVPGGSDNGATGAYSFAAGRRAKATGMGSFAWGDATDADVAATADNQFVVRASGGATFFSNPAATAGVTLAPGSGSWSSLSDRSAKTDVAAVDAESVLNSLSRIPMQTWRYKTQAHGVRHIGPMAQDFAAAFNVGEDNRHISGVDADGVALAAIQGLYQVVQNKDAQIAALQSQVIVQQKQLDALNHRLDALETNGPPRK